MTTPQDGELPIQPYLLEHGYSIQLDAVRSVAVFPGTRVDNGQPVYAVESVNSEGHVSRMAWSQDGAKALHQLLGGALERKEHGTVQELITRVVAKIESMPGEEIAVDRWQWRLVPAVLEGKASAD